MRSEGRLPTDPPPTDQAKAAKCYGADGVFLGSRPQRGDQRADSVVDLAGNRKEKARWDPRVSAGPQAPMLLWMGVRRLVPAEARNVTVSRAGVGRVRPVERGGGR